MSRQSDLSEGTSSRTAAADSPLKTLDSRLKTSTTIVVLQGDETGQELLEEALRVLQPDVIGFPLTFDAYDLSLENRRRTQNGVVHEAAAAMREAGFGLKAATVTPEDKRDVRSPNAILRKEIDGKVIVRTGRRIPHVAPVAGIHHPISIIRMAVDDAYGAREWREGEDLEELAFRTEQISRRTCRAVCEYAFRQARRTGATVFGGPKFTVSPIYEGMFKEEMDRAAAQHPDVPYEPQLIDATFALLLTTSGKALVIPTLNRDGDLLSDLVLQLFGSIAGAESLLLSFDDQFRIRVVMAEAPHGTAPRLFGKNIANPMAMILAAGSLLGHFREDAAAHAAARAIQEATFQVVEDGLRTVDIGGACTTTEFTDAVIACVKEKIRRAA